MSGRCRSVGASGAIATALIGLLAGSPPARAADRALLIAASDYEGRPLQGPANDAALLYHALRARGIEPAQIRLLADRLPASDQGPVPTGRPTRAAILAAFDELAKEARPGDTVFIAMSGHGTQAPARDPASEPDGLDELFLPIDVGRWDQSKNEVSNALRDDEIGERLERITAAGAFVWILIDSCHSGTATRNIGGRSLRARFVSPDDLGIPPAPASAGDTGAPQPSIDRRPSGRLVAFYAAQANEVAYETELPAEEASAASPHGVLSFFVAQALTRRPDASYLEIAQAVRAGYDRLAGMWPKFPTPLFEGALERQVFGATGAPVDAWPARRDFDAVRLAAGSLHGLSRGDEVVLHAPGGGDEPIARGVVGSLGLVESSVVVDAPAAERLPSQLIARAAAPSGPRPLRVAPPAGPDPLATQLRERLAERLAARPDIELVQPPAAADLEVAITNEWAALAPTGTSIAEIVQAGAAPVPLDLGPEEIATRLAKAIVARAPTFRLLTLASDVAGSRAARDLSLDLRLLRDPAGAGGDPARVCQRPPPELPAAAEALAAATTPELFHCDTLYVALEARGRDPIDLGLFFIDSTGAIVALPGPSPFRLERKAPPVVLRLTATTWEWQRSAPSTVGLERLVILGVRRSDKIDQAYQVDFAAALGLADDKTLALEGSPAHPFLGLLGPDSGQTRSGVGRGDPREDGFMHIVRWQTRRAQP